MKILRKPEVAELTGYSERSIDRLEKVGQFPKRLRLGARAVGWLETDVVEWIATRARGGCPSPAHHHAV